MNGDIDNPDVTGPERDSRPPHPSFKPEVMSRRSALLSRLVNRQFTRLLKKDFHATRLLHHPPGVTGPLIVFSNHPSWNDPMVISFLHHRFFPDREAYGPIDARALEGYGFLGRTGLYGIARGESTGARHFLRTSLAILEHPDTAIWITPQGKFADVRERPPRFEPGLGALLQRAPFPVTALPLAIEYSFGEERFPEIFLSFGEPVAPPAEGSPGNWTGICEAALQRTQDELAQRMMERDYSEFTTILGGATGVGGIYDGWRRIKAALTGKKYDPSHGSLTT